MTSRWQFYLKQLTQRVWVRAGLFSMLGVFTAIAAALLDTAIPPSWESRLGAGSIDSILNILATSMLTITTFSLSTMVAAYSAAQSQVTPRATKLMIADTTTHNVLATFIGTFLYSLVGIIVLSTEAYGRGGRVVLYLVTLGVILIVVGALLRWIDYLTRLGRVNETTRTIETATAEAIKEYVDFPCFGANRYEGDTRSGPPYSTPLHSERIGFIRHIDMQMLENLAAEKEAHLTIAAIPGRFVHRGQPLLFVSGQEPDADEMRTAFTIGDERNFAQDPLYGLSVMAEVASRALSPGVNDPGTAIDVIGRSVRLLAMWERSRRQPPTDFPHLSAPEISVAECFTHIFVPIGRDGAGMVEVQIRIQDALKALVDMNPELFAGPARHHAQLALERSRKAMSVDDDLRRVEAAAEAVLK